jgi:AraC-like DNA-binding protein
VSRAQEDVNRRMLRARDAIDREYGKALDVPALAKVAIVSEAHFIRQFKAVFGETPHRYLQRRRIERAMALLRATELTVGEICVEVGFASSATFSRTFRAVVGVSPTQFRDNNAAEAPGPAEAVPTCFTKAWTRPSSFGTAPAAARP